MGEGLIHMHAKFEKASPKTLEAFDIFPKSWRRPHARQVPPHRFSSADRRYSGAKNLYIIKKFQILALKTSLDCLS